MPPIFRFYFRHVAIGFAVAAAFVALVMAMDVGGLRGLVLGSPDGMLALFLLFVLNGLVFGGAQASVAVFLLARDPGPPLGPRRVEAPTRVPRVGR